MSLFASDKGDTPEKNAVHITESIGGNWFYHVSPQGINGKAVCGARTMHTSVPLNAWGIKTHLNERYCSECAKSLNT